MLEKQDTSCALFIVKGFIGLSWRIQEQTLKLAKCHFLPFKCYMLLFNNSLGNVTFSDTGSCSGDPGTAIFEELCNNWVAHSQRPPKCCTWQSFATEMILSSIRYMLAIFSVVECTGLLQANDFQTCSSRHSQAFAGLLFPSLGTSIYWKILCSKHVYVRSIE